VSAKETWVLREKDRGSSVSPLGKKKNLTFFKRKRSGLKGEGKKNIAPSAAGGIAFLRKDSPPRCRREINKNNVFLMKRERWGGGRYFMSSRRNRVPKEGVQCFTKLFLTSGENDKTARGRKKMLLLREGTGRASHKRERVSFLDPHTARRRRKKVLVFRERKRGRCQPPLRRGKERGITSLSFGGGGGGGASHPLYPCREGKDGAPLEEEVKKRKKAHPSGLAEFGPGKKRRTPFSKGTALTTLWGKKKRKGTDV